MINGWLNAGSVNKTLIQYCGWDPLTQDVMWAWQAWSDPALYSLHNPGNDRPGGWNACYNLAPPIILSYSMTIIQFFIIQPQISQEFMMFFRIRGDFLRHSWRVWSQEKAFHKCPGHVALHSVQHITMSTFKHLDQIGNPQHVWCCLIVWVLSKI